MNEIGGRESSFGPKGKEGKLIGFALLEAIQPMKAKRCVYDVTKFLDDHPGGGDVVVSSTAKDATDDFEDVGHSKNARKMLNDYYIGDIDLSTMKSTGVKSPTSSKQAQQPPSSTSSSSSSSSSSNLTAKILQFLIPLIILGFAFGIRFYKKSE
ncbi:hypothetical protein PIB30_047234 [Stylosanthes scabra]|uniref:Cytochrome b5 heme-binding domain-containing protein n=1 Tax=Stylosanthes scabra TaxID=79078 RepID=A0ABU6XHY9_9FABA|nr:hypothetical protein [Stylosanthes scabra]